MDGTQRTNQIYESKKRGTENNTLKHVHIEREYYQRGVFSDTETTAIK